jgi:tetratricopeptide (TPR) repeat protein
MANANLKLADIFLAGGNFPAALKNSRQAQQVFESLAPNDAQAKNNLRMVTERIGTIQLQQGDKNGAFESYRSYLKIAQEIYQANPSDATARRGVALAFEKVGQTMAQADAVDEGLRKLYDARSLFEQIATVDPQIRSRKDLATVHAVIGDILATAGRNEDATKSLRQALDITRKLVAEDPKNNSYNQLLYDVRFRLANTLYKEGKFEEARQETMKVLQVLRPMVDGPEPAPRDVELYCELLLTTPFPDLRQPEIARQLANRLDASNLDVLAQAVYDARDAAQAVEIEKKALAQLPSNVVSEQKKLLEANLAKFRAGAERKQAQ